MRGLGFHSPAFVAGLTPLASAWSPADLFASSESGDYFDPSDLSRMWQDTAKTTAVTSDGDPVRVIEGQEGHFDLVAPSDAARPLYKTASGLHWLAFDGVDDVMSAASFLWAAGEGSIFLGARLTAGLGRTTVTEGNSASTQQNMAYIRTGDANSSRMTQYLRGNSADIIVPHSGPEAYDGTDRVLVFIDTGSTIGNTVNTTSDTPRSYTRVAVTLTNFSVGALVRTSATNFTALRMYSLIARGLETTGDDFTDARAWTADKAGVTL